MDCWSWEYRTPTIRSISRQGDNEEFESVNDARHSPPAWAAEEVVRVHRGPTIPLRTRTPASGSRKRGKMASRESTLISATRAQNVQ